LSAILLPGTRWTFVPWLLLYAGGFSYVGGLSFYQAHQLHRWARLTSRGAAEVGVVR